MNIFQPLFMLLLLLLLTGCVKPLQPGNYAGQLQPTWLDANRFIVAYPQKSPDAKIVDLTLLRSAEIALQNGFNYFIVVDTGDSSAASAPVQQDSGAGFIVHNGIRYNLANPGSSNTIVGFKRKPEGFSYVALFVKASLRDKYNLDKPPASI